LKAEAEEEKRLIKLEEEQRRLEALYVVCDPSTFFHLINSVVMLCYVNRGLRPKRARAVSAMDTHALQTALMKGIQDEDEKNDKKVKADRVAGIGSSVYVIIISYHNHINTCL
jgi:hypothetical protein